MRRIALVFILSILLPAVLLAVLAVRSLRDQEFIVSSQRTQLHQSNCDTLTDRINLFMNDVRVFYGQLVERLVDDGEADLVENFEELLKARWGQAAATAVVSNDGVILSPSGEPGTAGAEFLSNHADFLTNRRVVEVYQAPRLLGAQIQLDSESPASVNEVVTAEVNSMRKMTDTPQKWKVGVVESRNVPTRGISGSSVPPKEISPPRAFAPTPPPMPSASSGPSDQMVRSKSENFADLSSSQSVPEPLTRNVMPMQQRVSSEVAREESSGHAAAPVANLSALSPEAVMLEELTSQEDEGAVSRLINGELHVLLWKRHPLRPGLTFWTELDLTAIRTDLADLFSREPQSVSPGEVSLALLDSNGKVVAQTAKEFTTDWSTPFVAAEVGQILPRWEVAAYLLDPASLNASARTIRLTLWLITLTLLGAVAGGSFLILRSVNYEMRIASQKTDFVGNVSHELKTPLTSIRMFSELLRDAENPDPDKTRQYSGVISKESARLTRLINRLLDFSRLDRGELQLKQEGLDLSALARETVEDYRPQLEAVGMVVRLTTPPDSGPPVRGDRDALSQVILNLLSNAEKYAAKGGEVIVEIAAKDPLAVLSVTDRGPGIPRAHQRRIFEKFYRVDESITSGIEGSGIGLALCRQIVELHGGTIRYEAGKGGGSTFLIELPLAT